MPGASRSDRPHVPRIAVVPTAIARSSTAAPDADVLDREGALGLAGHANRFGERPAVGVTRRSSALSRWTWASTKPGTTNRPAASIRRRVAAPARSPTAATVPARIPTSARRPSGASRPAGHQVERLHVREDTRPSGSCRVRRDPDAPTQEPYNGRRRRGRASERAPICVGGAAAGRWVSAEPALRARSRARDGPTVHSIERRRRQARAAALSPGSRWRARGAVSALELKGSAANRTRARPSRSRSTRYSITPMPAGKKVWCVAHSSGAVARRRPVTRSRTGLVGRVVVPDGLGPAGHEPPTGREARPGRLRPERERLPRRRRGQSVQRRRCRRAAHAGLAPRGRPRRPRVRPTWVRSTTAPRRPRSRGASDRP